MTRRNRLLNLLDGRGIDRPVWTTLIDQATRANMPNLIKEMDHLEFYRYISCDVLQFGICGLRNAESLATPCHLVSPGVETIYSMNLDGSVFIGRKSEWGNLTSSFRNGHPLIYPVQSLADIIILKNIWLNSYYEESEGYEASITRIMSEIGDDGIYAETVAPSPIQHLIETEMGLSGFYYMFDDHRRDVDELLDIMHNRRLDEYRIIARRSGADVVIPIENTSSLLTSPAIYSGYSLLHMKDYISALHEYSKKAVIHMCGHLKHLIPAIAQTGLDGVNGLTPFPVGDTAYEDVLDAFGDNFVILGGVFPPEILHKSDLTYAQLSAALDSLYTSRIRRSPFLLWAAVDGLPTDMHRFEMLRKWFDGQS